MAVYQKRREVKNGKIKEFDAQNLNKFAGPLEGGVVSFLAHFLLLLK